MELRSKTVHFEAREGLACITLTAPQQNNVLNPGMIEDLSFCLDQAASHSSLRAIVLRAEGEHFCQGMSLTDDGVFEAPRPYFEAFYRCLLKIYESPKPTIAYVNGQVTGGGCGLVAACDIVLASHKAAFMLPEAIWGLTPALIVPFLLPRLSPGKLNYLIQSTRNLPAPEALAVGLIDELSEEPRDQILKSQLKRVFRSQPLALKEAKCYVQSLALHPRQFLESALNYQCEWISKPENLKGLQLYREGLTPEWFQKPPHWG